MDQQADGGMLFLDEIHRLPPEGQEMIFFLWIMEPIAGLVKQAKSFCECSTVGATTEDPHSALLDTFVRRIDQYSNAAFGSRPAAEQLT
ncbi:MAG: sigma 54-interacting transcriptional regulator [Enterococcus gallinarum]